MCIELLAESKKNLIQKLVPVYKKCYFYFYFDSHEKID